MKAIFKNRIFYFILTVLIFVLSFETLRCQNESGLKNIDSNNILINNYEKGTAVVTTDTTSDSNRIEKENKYIPLSEFIYADNQRYTISGNLPLKETEIKPLSTLAFGAGFSAVFVAQHIFQLRTLWDTLGPFKFAEDISQDLWSDKTDHFFDSYFASYLLRDVLMECGFSNDAAYVWGGILGLTYLNYIEVLDGFGANWGFSPSDLYANVAGAVYFVGQHYVPFLQNFTPKFTYFPANWHGDEQRLPHEVFIDDYSSHTTWLSVNVHNLLPESLKNYWPSWLQLSFGYAARNLFAYENYSYSPEIKEINKELIEKYRTLTDIKTDKVWGSPRYIIALDYDLVKIIPEDGSFWNWMRQTLTFMKLPSPAIEFSKSKTRFYLVYPFKF